MKRIQRIVVGTDFSGIAEKAVDHAVDLAKLTGAAVTMVHAYELPILSLPDGEITTSLDLATALSASGLARLEQALTRYKDSGVVVSTLLRLGAPWDELNSVAAEQRADLIVVGTHGRRGLSRALIGSVAERLVRTAFCPVLVVHGGVPPS